MDILTGVRISGTEDQGRFNVTLSPSLTGAIALVVVDFYREHPFLRGATAYVGIPLLLLGAWGFLTLGFEWWDVAVYGALLSALAVFSSSRFHVVMAAPPEEADADAEEVAAVATPLGPLASARKHAEEFRDQARAREASSMRGAAWLGAVAGVCLVGGAAFLAVTSAPGWGLIAGLGLGTGLASAFWLGHARRHARVAAEHEARLIDLDALDGALRTVDDTPGWLTRRQDVVAALLRSTLGMATPLVEGAAPVTVARPAPAESGRPDAMHPSPDHDSPAIPSA